jgi:beta-mannosidase
MANEAAGTSLVDLGGEWAFAISERRLPSPLRGEADLRNAGLDVRPATVPGCVELDLLANGLIADPFIGTNVIDLRRLEHSYVYYVRPFRAPAVGDRDPVLVFEGLDCFAEITLNGVLVGTTDNMLVEHEIPVGSSLIPGAENILCVAIDPAVERARSRPYPPGLRADASGYEALYVRKAPHMYGWDITPRAVSAGIWRPVSLRLLPPERLDLAWLDTESLAQDGSAATVVLRYRTRKAGAFDDRWQLRVVGTCGDSRFEAERALLFEAGALRLTVDAPRLWWPRGRGAPDLYDVTVELIHDGNVVDTVRFEHGIRTVELRRTSTTNADGDGDFCFQVNGEPLFVLGTNWAPLDAYHARDAARLEQAFAMAVDLGCNMIRCWGGSVYESDRFFELCDRAGVLVWQDFAMACAIYPQDGEFQAQLRAEAQNVVRRLRQHPSLAVWCGDNECDETYVWTGGRRRDPNTNVLTRTVLPGVLRDEDPSRPYLPSSPYVDAVAFATGRRELPEDHLWGPRDYYKSSFYTGSVCHFASEIGFLGIPSVESLREYLTAEKLWPPDDEEWRLHSTAPLPGIALHDYRVRLMQTQVRNVFGDAPDELEDFVFASQAVQAEALKFFIELFRAQKWRRTGIIWWDLIDGWPQVSDAVVDYYLRRKPAYDAVKTAQAPVSVIVREPVDGSYAIVAVNDTRNDEPLRFAIRDLDRHEVGQSGSAVAVADAVSALGQINDATGEQRFLVIDWETRAGAARSHYLAGTPPFSLDQYRTWRQRMDALPPPEATFEKPSVRGAN